MAPFLLTPQFILGCVSDVYLPVNGENVEVTQTFTYLGSVIHSSTSCGLEVSRRLGRAWSAMNSLDEGVRRC